MKAQLDESNSRNMIMIEDDVHELKPEDVEYVNYIAIQRTFEQVNWEIRAPVKHVFNRQRHKYRSTDQLTAIKGELEF